MSVTAQQIALHAAVALDHPGVLRSLAGEPFEQTGARGAERAQCPSREWRANRRSRAAELRDASWRRRRLAHRRHGRRQLFAVQKEPREAVLRDEAPLPIQDFARRSRVEPRHDALGDEREPFVEQQCPDASVPRGGIDEDHRDPRERTVGQCRDRSNHQPVSDRDERAAGSGRQKVQPILLGLVPAAPAAQAEPGGNVGQRSSRGSARRQAMTSAAS